MLSSSRTADLRLFVLDAALHLTSYKSVFTDEQMALATRNPNPEASVIMNTSDNQACVNLLVPPVFNADTGSCLQDILEGQGGPFRSTLPH